MTFRVFIPGQPQGKGRARSATMKNKKTGLTMVNKKTGAPVITHFTPERTRKFENKIKSYAIGAMGLDGPMTGPVEITIKAIFEIPQSWPKWKRQAAIDLEILPTLKPDLDNIEKSVMDGFNEVVWNDDTQVVKSTKVKYYGEKPGILVFVSPLAAKSHDSKRADFVQEKQGALI